MQAPESEVREEKNKKTSSRPVASSPVKLNMIERRYSFSRSSRNTPKGSAKKNHKEDISNAMQSISSSPRSKSMTPRRSISNLTQPLIEASSRLQDTETIATPKQLFHLKTIARLPSDLEIVEPIPSPPSARKPYTKSAPSTPRVSKKNDSEKINEDVEEKAKQKIGERSKTISFRDESKNEEIKQEEIKDEIKENVAENAKNFDRWIKAAILRDNNELINYLLKYKKDKDDTFFHINRLNKRANTQRLLIKTLMCATKNNHSDMANILLSTIKSFCSSQDFLRIQVQAMTTASKNNYLSLAQELGSKQDIHPHFDQEKYIKEVKKGKIKNYIRENCEAKIVGEPIDIALVYMASEGHDQLLRALLTYLDTKDTIVQHIKSITIAIFNAAQHGHSHCLLSLLNILTPLKHAAYLSENGDTTLMTAAGNGHYDCVDVLLKHEAIRKSINHINKKGQTAFLIAAQKNHLKVVVQFLLKYKAGLFVHIQDHAEYNPLQHMDHDGYNALQYAVNNLNVAMVQTLLEHGINVNTQTLIKRQTPLILATIHNALSICTLLLSREDINIDLRDQEGNDFLFYAIQLNRPEIVKQFLVHVKERMQKDEIYVPQYHLAHALRYAVQFNKVAIVQILLAFIEDEEVIEEREKNECYLPAHQFIAICKTAQKVKADMAILEALTQHNPKAYRFYHHKYPQIKNIIAPRAASLGLNQAASPLILPPIPPLVAIPQLPVPALPLSQVDSIAAAPLPLKSARGEGEKRDTGLTNIFDRDKTEELLQQYNRQLEMISSPFSTRRPSNPGSPTNRTPRFFQRLPSQNLEDEKSISAPNHNDDNADNSSIYSEENEYSPGGEDEQKTPRIRR